MGVLVSESISVTRMVTERASTRGPSGPKNNVSV